MPGDASTRSYARLVRDDGGVILMNSPQRPDGAAIYNGKSYSTAVHLAENIKPFVALDEGLCELSRVLKPGALFLLWRPKSTCPRTIPALPAR